MSRRERRAHGERTRARILAAALPLFAESGYAGTSTRMVAQAAEVNVATLAYHFEGKEGLYQAVMAELFRVLLEELPAVVARDAAPVEVVESLVRGLWDFARVHPLHVRLVLRHILDSEQLPSPVAERGYDRLLDHAVRLGAIFHPEWSQASRHLFFLSLAHLVFRFALEAPGQLAALLGSPDDVDEAVVRWLTHLSMAVLLSPMPPALPAAPGAQDLAPEA